MKRVITGVILAGGRNIRMGTNKAFLEIEKERLIDKNIHLLTEICTEVIVVVSNPLDYLSLNAAIATDIFPGKGALGGLYSGLFFTGTPRAFVAACDMPLLNRGFIKYMIDNAKEADIVVPAPPDGLQPLCAVYSRTCLPAIKALLDKNRLQIKGFYPGHKIREIPPAVINSFDPEGRMFTNLNTPEDFRKLKNAGIPSG